MLLILTIRMWGVDDTVDVSSSDEVVVEEVV
jgi:hypothetical protein